MRVIASLVMQRLASVLCTFCLLMLAAASVRAEQAAPSEAAKDMVGAWEISNAARDKTCSLTFKLDAAAGGFALEHGCGTVFPSLKDVIAWAMTQDDEVRLLDSKGAVVLEFGEVESGMYEAERKGEGLYFMRSQAAIKEATTSPEQLFGDWILLQEADKPLCEITLSNAASDESFKIIVKPGCSAGIAGFGLATWRLDSGELLMSGRAGNWRLSESDATIWERIPPSTDPLLMMRK
jgi:hypothetical protein